MLELLGLFQLSSSENPNSQPSVGVHCLNLGLLTMSVLYPFPSVLDILGEDFKAKARMFLITLLIFNADKNVPSVLDFLLADEQSGFFLNHNSQAGYSRFGAGNDFMSQEYMNHGSQGLFTQAGFNDPSQDDASQSHFGVANPNQLQSQGLMNSLYSQPFAHFNTQPLNLLPPQQQQPQQGQGSQNQHLHYNG
ncbi:regulator of nonsense transcripts 1 homolog [Hibiscus syriacus]|uniref:regulator of nonsense transcripts 1 homolog n=1 Tax=Hibiscus syriacus TaxID=106335 RepID=UPI0019244F4B|nr:regulator of nonsense transcripts 1 homolog [Hibiscus syriacus]